jgi:hypothetical protein
MAGLGASKTEIDRRAEAKRRAEGINAGMEIDKCNVTLTVS